MQTLQFLAPILAGLCLDNFITMQGEICNFREPPAPRLVFYEPDKACYRDGVFYPRCKDFENPEVQHYHNLLKNK